MGLELHLYRRSGHILQFPVRERIQQTIPRDSYFLRFQFLQSLFLWRIHYNYDNGHRNTKSLLGIDQGIVFIKPLINTSIFFRIQLHLDWLKRFNIQDVISVIQRRFLIIKWGKPHSLEMSPVSLLTTHHDPHGAKSRSNIQFYILWVMQKREIEQNSPYSSWRN